MAEYRGNRKQMQMIGVSVGGMERDEAALGGMSVRAHAEDANRLAPMGGSRGTADAVAGLALCASAVLAVIVAMARTRIASQEAAIERLRGRDFGADPGAGPCGGMNEWIERSADTAADRSVLRISER